MQAVVKPKRSSEIQREFDKSKEMQLTSTHAIFQDFSASTEKK